MARCSLIVFVVFVVGGAVWGAPQQQQQQQPEFQSRNTYDLANRGAYLPLGETQFAALQGVSSALRNAGGNAANLVPPQRQQQQQQVSQGAPQQQVLQDSYVVAKQQQQSSSLNDGYQGERIPGEYSAVDSYAAYNNYRLNN